MGSNYKEFEFGPALEDIIQAAREFGEKMKEMGPDWGPFGSDCPFDRIFDRGPEGRPGGRRERHRFYPFPPANIYSARDGSLVLEFAFAGIEESTVSVTFQGDYLVLSAKASERESETEAGGFSRRGFRPRDVDRQKYLVPAEDYSQDEAKAAFKNGVLTVRVPPKAGESEGIKIEIVKEGD
jgi:HSP20 family molecular chaperone IbpA